MNTAQNGVQRFKRTDDKCVSVWDIRMIHRFNNDCAREDDVRLALKDGLVLSPDGRFLAACLKNQERNPDSLQIWDVATWELVKMRSLAPENLSSLTWSPDGNFLAYVCSGIELWDLRTDEAETLYRGEQPSSRAIAFSSNSQQLAYLTSSYDLGLVDVTTGTTIGKRNVGEAVWLRFSDDDQMLYTPKGRIDIASFFSVEWSQRAFTNQDRRSTWNDQRSIDKFSTQIANSINVVARSVPYHFPLK